MDAAKMRTEAASNDRERERRERDTMGSRPIADVLPTEVQAWVTNRAQALGPLAMRNLYSFLKSVFA